MKRYKHNLSHYHLTTGNIGDLIPIGWLDVLPGDSLNVQTKVFARATPLLAPVMHPLAIRIHHFFVPIRLVDPNFEDKITGADPDVVLKRYSVTGPGNQLLDYLGVPQQRFTGDIIAHPLDAYELIWKEYYRDQQLQPYVPPLVPTVRQINYAKDPLSTVRYSPVQPGSQVAAVDLEEAYVKATDIREALAKQRFDEARARYGNRYVEYLQYLGVTPTDARLQLPEYVGGGTGNLNFSEVLTTFEDDTSEPVGTLKGHGVAGVSHRPFTKFFPEHGIFMTLMSLRPKAIYPEGIARYWYKREKDDYWQRELEHIGQQEVKAREVWANESDVENNAIWGYQDRYWEYRKKLSYVTGEMRNLYDYWHLGRHFSNRPGLNSNWPVVKPADNKRIFADQTNDQMLFACNHRIRARRLVSRDSSGRAI